MSNVWAKFPYNGDKNIEELPNCQPYNSQNGEIMIFNYKCRIRNNYEKKPEENIN